MKMAVIRLIVLRAAELSFNVLNAEHFSYICTRQVRWMLSGNSIYTAISASTANHHVFYFRLGNNLLACLLAFWHQLKSLQWEFFFLPISVFRSDVIASKTRSHIWKGSNRVNQISLALSKKMNDTRLIWFRNLYGDICDEKKRRNEWKIYSEW